MLDEAPHSRFAPNADIARADALFEQNDMQRARALYEALPRDSALWPYARYKLAWVDENVGSHAQALAALDELIGLSDAHSLPDDAATLEIIAQCRQDVVKLAR